MGDTGLLTRLSGISDKAVLYGEDSMYLGMIAENYVAQALTANRFKLNYWTSGNTAELDFILQKEGKITAVEVKGGTHTRSKSLDEFLKSYSPDTVYRISMKNFGEKGKFYPIPLYAAFCIK
jgi:predicted AAA+ superfamily ATPase